MLKKMTKSYKEEADNTICKFCGEYFDYLGSHLWHRHKVKARDYKAKFELDYNLPLMSQKTMDKKRAAFEKDREKYLKNLNRGFKKGEQKRVRFSEQSKDRVRKVGKEAVKYTEGVCHVCKMKYKNVHSHLREKHGLKFC